MDSTLESNYIHLSIKFRVKVFCKIYKKTILFFLIPMLLLPIVFLGDNNAYLCFYAFLITASYWIFEVLHPAVTSLIPVALSTIMSLFGYEIMNFINIGNILFDCFGMLIFIVAIEDSNVHKRIAIKTLLIFGCSHYRLCFLLFFTTMLLSMWISNTLACGFMIPITKAILFELEKMGILDFYETVEKRSGYEHNNKNISIQTPTDFTVFYFLGIAYSSSIGGMTTMVGSQANHILKVYSETLFPLGPKIDFPQFMLLTLPAVLVLETMLYLWMNFYFLGLFRIHNYSTLQSGSTEEEAQYVKTILKIEYEKLKSITSKEMIVIFSFTLCAFLQTTTSSHFYYHNFIASTQVFAPTILCTLILFMFPTNMDFLKFCRKGFGSRLNPLPSSPSSSCLSWRTLRNEVHWTVILVTGGSCAMFEALKQSKMTVELDKFLQLFDQWSASLLVLAVVIFCKILTEFACNTCVAKIMLEHIARLSVSSRTHPHYLMVSVVLACSLPFHTIVGTPANAMVVSYFNIPPRRLMYAGIGPSIFAVSVIWFTISVWSKAIWTDISVFPSWAIPNSNLTT